MTQLALFPDTLAQARATVAAALVPGAAHLRCPCCEQGVKLYERRLRPAWARVLLDLLRADECGDGGWLLLDNAHAVGAAAARDWSTMRHWLLIERHPERAGMWRLTETGRAFVCDGVALPAVCFVFNNRCHGFGPERVTFTDVLAESSGRVAA